MMRPLYIPKPGPYNDITIAPASGYRSCRIVQGEPCYCTVAFALDDGTCPCAPGDTSNPLAIFPIIKPKEPE
jgi:hypothetical protein